MLSSLVRQTALQVNVHDIKNPSVDGYLQFMVIVVELFCLLVLIEGSSEGDVQNAKEETNGPVRKRSMPM